MFVVPVVLMLGSVYTHTVASRLEREGAWLEEQKVRAESEGEHLDLRISDLSEPGRIRTIATNDLEMQDPGKDLENYVSSGEDMAHGGEEKREKIGK